MTLFSPSEKTDEAAIEASKEAERDPGDLVIHELSEPPPLPAPELSKIGTGGH